MSNLNKSIETCTAESNKSINESILKSNQNFRNSLGLGLSPKKYEESNIDDNNQNIYNRQTGSPSFKRTDDNSNDRNDNKNSHNHNNDNGNNYMNENTLLFLSPSKNMNRNVHNSTNSMYVHSDKIENEKNMFRNPNIENEKNVRGNNSGFSQGGGCQSYSNISHIQNIDSASDRYFICVFLYVYCFVYVYLCILFGCVYMCMNTWIYIYTHMYVIIYSTHSIITRIRTYINTCIHT